MRSVCQAKDNKCIGPKVDKALGGIMLLVTDLPYIFLKIFRL